MTTGFVPDVRGQDSTTAINLLIDSGFRFAGFGQNYSDSVAVDVVIDADPPVGTELELGTSVAIVLSIGPAPVPPPPPTNIVPDVRGLTTDDAENTLRAGGYEPFPIRGAYDIHLDEGLVLFTDPGAGTFLEGGFGLRVGYVYSLGNGGPVKPPDITTPPFLTE